MKSPDARVEIGYVARAHGTRGNVVIVVHNPESSALLTAESVFVGGSELAIEGLELTKGGFRVGFETVTDRTQAEALRGQKITVLRSDPLSLSLVKYCFPIWSDAAPFYRMAARGERWFGSKLGLRIGS